MIVLVYIFLGGLTSAIYNEVLQFFLIVLGLPAAGVPGPAATSGGWSGLNERLAKRVDRATAIAPGAWTESWQHMAQRRPPTRWASSGSAW